MEEHLVEHLTDKTDVELALRRAQFWILNPKDSMNHILSLSMEELRAPRENALAYSRNVVCLDISGPELTDLSFVDLPGMSLECISAKICSNMPNSLIRHHSKCGEPPCPTC